MPCWTWTRDLGTVRQSACNRPTNKNDTASILAPWPGPREVGTLRQDWPCCQPSSRLASQTCSAMLLSQPCFLQIFSASSVWEWKAQYVDQIKRQRPERRHTAVPRQWYRPRQETSVEKMPSGNTVL